MEHPHEPPLIEIEGLSKTYSLGEVQVHALDGVSLAIRQGEIVFIMGPSGSGKTTLVNLIGGIDSPTSGRISVCGDDLGGLSPRKLTQYRRKRLAFVFQFYSLIPTLTVVENVELTMELMKYDKKTIRQDAIKFLATVGLEDRLKNCPAQRAGGKRERVAIARALAKNPDILLVDEPTGQLDQESGQKVVELIRSIAKAQQKTVILVTHDGELKKYADRLIVLRSGKIVSDTATTVGDQHETNL